METQVLTPFEGVSQLTVISHRFFANPDPAQFQIALPKLLPLQILNEMGELLSSSLGAGGEHLREAEATQPGGVATPVSPPGRGSSRRHAKYAWRLGKSGRRLPHQLWMQKIYVVLAVGHVFVVFQNHVGHGRRLHLRRPFPLLGLRLECSPQEGQQSRVILHGSRLPQEWVNCKDCSSDRFKRYSTSSLARSCPGIQRRS